MQLISPFERKLISFISRSQSQICEFNTAAHGHLFDVLGDGGEYFALQRQLCHCGEAGLAKTVGDYVSELAVTVIGLVVRLRFECTLLCGFLLLLDNAGDFFDVGCLK